MNPRCTEGQSSKEVDSVDNIQRWARIPESRVAAKNFVFVFREILCFAKFYLNFAKFSRNTKLKLKRNFREIQGKIILRNCDS